MYGVLIHVMDSYENDLVFLNKTHQSEVFHPFVTLVGSQTFFILKNVCYNGKIYFVTESFLF